MAIEKFRRKKTVRKPDQVRIEPQRMAFRFENVPRHWAADNALFTHLLNALSLTFPDGERFFVDSVRAFRDQAATAEQDREIGGFIGQEAMHSMEHNTFNEMLAAQGYTEEADSGQDYARERIRQGQKHLTELQQLAITAALEHITAILADGLLRDPELIESLDASVRDLWIWHAIEETEHKAVAYDLFQQVSGDYRLRAGLFLTATSALGAYAAAYTWRFMKRDGLHRNPGAVASGLWKLFGWKGFLVRLVPDYLDYLRPGFHPWDKDNSTRIEQWRAVLEGYTNGERAA